MQKVGSAEKFHADTIISCSCSSKNLSISMRSKQCALTLQANPFPNGLKHVKVLKLLSNCHWNQKPFLILLRLCFPYWNSSVFIKPPIKLRWKNENGQSFSFLFIPSYPVNQLRWLVLKRWIYRLHRLSMQKFQNRAIYAFGSLLEFSPKKGPFFFRS